MNKDKFRFFAPVDFLEKAKDKKGNEVYRVGGIISDSSTDSDGENLDPNGFDFSEFNFINWNHGKSPSDIIGEPETLKVIPNKGVYMEGYIIGVLRCCIYNTCFNISILLMRELKTSTCGVYNTVCNLSI